MNRGARPTDVSPDSSIFGRDRRRTRRHRVHTPAYASCSGSAQTTVVELNEIINLSESGTCIQAPSQMKINRLLPLCLDLSATSSRISVVGHVVWSDPSGKTGIRFPEMSEASLSQLRRWLEVNAHAEAVAHANIASAEPAGASPLPPSKPVSSPAYTSLVNEWAEMEKEIDFYGPDLDPALHLIAQRALTLTWASGTAIALINKLKPSEMICRARAGSDAPEIGASLQSGAGFSGECVRSGKAIICDDAEYDARVDRKSCRALGIRSIVACPVKRDNQAIGILEVFSPEPAAFWENDITVLQRLAAFVARAVRTAEHARSNVLAFTPDDSPPSNVDPVLPAQPAESPSHIPLTRHRIALLLASVALLSVVIWLLLPRFTNFGSGNAEFNAPYSAHADSSPESYSGMNLKDLTKTADAGNPSAEYALAMRYATGEGTRQDYREALRLFLRSADQGNVRAQARAASWFWAGRGAPQDYSKAYYWALLAQAGGDESGRAIIQQTAPYLSPAQIAAEHQEAENWLHAHHIGKPSPSTR